MNTLTHWQNSHQCLLAYYYRCYSIFYWLSKFWAFHQDTVLCLTTIYTQQLLHLGGFVPSSIITGVTLVNEF